MKRSILTNAAIVILEIIAVLHAVSEMGKSIFIYYTVLSNILLGLSSLLTLFFLLRSSVPLFIRRLKYVSVCMTTVTMLVVIFILTPTVELTGVQEQSLLKSFSYLMFTGSMLYMHFICPVLAFISFTVFEKPEKYDKKLPLLGLVPTILYGAVMVPLNIIGKVKGPYPFLMVHEQSVLQSIIWTAVILSFAYLIAFSVNLASKRQPAMPGSTAENESSPRLQFHRS